MKRKNVILLCFVIGVLVIGCSKKQTGADLKLYYVNSEGNALVEEDYSLVEENSVEIAVEEILNMLQNPENQKENLPSIPSDINVKDIDVEGERVDISFGEEYKKLDKGAEVLLRAAVVQSLVQIKGVKQVSFYVLDEPLLDSYGNAIGAMSAEDFVQNTGSSLQAYQTVDLELYFSDKAGGKLKKEKREQIHYNTNTSVEKLVVEQVMKGTSSNKRSSTIPNSVKLLGVSVKDSVCYVNFNAAFLEEGYNQKPEVTIYSVVNSIIANGNVTKVQILIEGSQTNVYKGVIDLSEPLEWRADLMKE